MSWQQLNEELVLEDEGCDGHVIEAQRLCRSRVYLPLAPPPPNPWWLLFKRQFESVEYTTAAVQIWNVGEQGALGREADGCSTRCFSV